MSEKALNKLMEYKKLCEQQYDINNRLSEYKGLFKEKLLDKYYVGIKQNGFSVQSNNYIPLDDLKLIEKLTGARLYEVANFKYAFTW